MMDFKEAIEVLQQLEQSAKENNASVKVDLQISNTGITEVPSPDELKHWADMGGRSITLNIDIDNHKSFPQVVVESFQQIQENNKN